MPTISALIHTHNDERRIGRALESLRPCDAVMVIDHGSQDRTVAVARQYGAVVHAFPQAADSETLLHGAASPWILCLLPSEILSEELEGLLYQWKQADPGEIAAFSVAIREETPQGWRNRPPETRLLDGTRIRWSGTLPPAVEGAVLLSGELLRVLDGV